MKVLGVIPSRYASSRFPGKPLVDLKGKSMIQRVYEGACSCDRFDKVIVATDDQRIFDHVISFGGNVLMTKNTHKSGTDRCGEVAEKEPDFDLIVNIQGDEPLVQSSQLSDLIKAFENPEVSIATLGILDKNLDALKSENRIKLTTDTNDWALYFSRSLIPFSKTPEQVTYTKHIGLYAFRKKTLKALINLPQSRLEQLESLEQLRWMENGYRIKVVYTTIETPNIDAPDDVEKVIALL